MSILDYTQTERLISYGGIPNVEGILRDIGFCLTSQEQKVLRCLFEDVGTQEEIASRIGVSQQRIDRIQKNLQKKLQVLARLRDLFHRIDSGEMDYNTPTL